MITQIKLVLFITIIATLISVSYAGSINEDTADSYMIGCEDNCDEINYDDSIRECEKLYNQKIKENDEIQKNKNIKTTDNPTIINITSDNIDQSFNIEDNEIYINQAILSTSNDIVLNIYEIPSNINYLVLEDESSEYGDVNIHLVGQNNLTLHNFKVDINGFNQVTLENINFEYDADYSNQKYVQANDLTKKLIMNNVTIITERNDTVDLTVNVPPSDENNAIALSINTKALVENCTIHAKLKESLVDWDTDPGIPQQLGVMITGSDVLFKNNNITVIGNGPIAKAYYSTYAVFCNGKNLTFTGNIINISNTTGYSYGLVVRSSNNLVSNNNITIESKAYANAVYFARGIIHNNTISNNYLNVTCTSNKAPWGNYAVVYAIVLEDRNYVGGVYNPDRTTVKHNNIINNTIYASARQTYSIEVFGAIDLNITGNKMYNNGTAPMAIGIIGYNSSIFDNDITCVGTTNRTDGTVDYIVSRTVGVYAYLSDGINIMNNKLNMTKGRGIFLTKSNSILITNNMINTTLHDYTIDLNSTNVSIQFNLLSSRDHAGDESVNHSAGENITVKYNQYSSAILELTANDTIVNQTTPVLIKLKDNDENPLSNVKLILSIDDESRQIITNEEGICTYNYIAATKGIKYITAKLENYLVFEDTNTTVMIKAKIQPSILFDETTGYVDEDTVITAYITDENDEYVDSGSVLFKDNNDNLLDNVTLNDGIAKTKVKFSQTGSIIITAVYISDDEVLSDSQNSTTIIIKTRNPILNVDSISALTRDTINITARITAGDETLTDINKGKVVFKVNGKALKDANGKVIYAKVLNGVATIENYIVPDDWAKESTLIQVVYSGSAQCKKLTSEKTEITIEKTIPTLTTESITAKVGETITLTATITGGDKSINTGKIVFKINGKSIKDSNGKVIYTKVVNNTVNVEYTLPADMKSKNYNITAVFISSDYDRMEDGKILTVN
ncbi:MAG: Ig-like domain-containing protein [Methanosphaera sp.]|nr:Ig-like domain-containing protein [Methanosphaera sp.]